MLVTHVFVTYGGEAQSVVVLNSGDCGVNDTFGVVKVRVKYRSVVRGNMYTCTCEPLNCQCGSTCSER